MERADRIKELMSRLDGRGGRLREEVMDEIKEEGPSMIPFLLSRPPQPYIAELLGELGGAGSLPYLRRCLADERPAVRRQAADALCRIVERCEQGELKDGRALRIGLQKALVPLSRLTSEVAPGLEALVLPFQTAHRRLTEFINPKNYPLPSSAPLARSEHLPRAADHPRDED